MKEREVIRRNMQANKSKGTSIEVLMGKALWRNGLKFRKHNKNIYGCPDFSLKKYKLAIFVDGEFWHGKDWHLRKKDHKTNVEFWVNKIEKNILRDSKVNEILESEGWIVMRFWEREVRKNIEQCVIRVEKKINEIKDNK